MHRRSTEAAAIGASDLGQERWDEYSTEHGFGPATMNSFNHYAYGAIGQWLYETVLGVAPLESAPGFARFRVAPIPGGGLTYARGHADTMHGRIDSGWQLENGRFRYELTVPPNTVAELTMPYVAPLVEGRSARFNAQGRPEAELRPGHHIFAQTLNC